MEKDALKRKIIDNINQRRRDPHNNLDRLEFLITAKVTESTFFELKEPIKLKNSWKKKVGNYLVMALASSFLIYGTIKYSGLGQWWQWVILLIIIVGAFSFFVKFFEDKVILEISSSGLLLDNYVFNKWTDIEFLYYKTKYDGDGNNDGTYLIERLKNGYEHELMISDLPWSTEKLGRMLYQCMKRYGK